MTGGSDVCSSDLKIEEIENELEGKKTKPCCAHELESQKEEAEIIAALEKQLKEK